MYEAGAHLDPHSSLATIGGRITAITVILQFSDDNLRFREGQGLIQGHTAVGPPSPMGGLPPGETAYRSPSLAPGCLLKCCQQPAPPPPHLGRGPRVRPAACRVGGPSPSHPVSCHSLPLPPGTSHPPCRLGRDSWPPSCPESDMLAELSASLDGPWTHHTVSWSCTCCLQGSHPLSLHPTAQNTEGPEQDPSPPWAWVSGCRGSQADNSPTLHHEPKGPTARVLWGRCGHCKAMSRENHGASPGPCPQPSNTAGSLGQNRRKLPSPSLQHAQAPGWALPHAISNNSPLPGGGN